MAAQHLRFTTLLGKSVHLGVCGSIAAYKALDVLRFLKDIGVNVSATLTQAAARFVTPLTFSALGASEVYAPLFAGESGPFDHLKPGTHAGALCIAPASANTLAKMALGMADDMLSCQALSFAGPVIVAPAMNPRMWANPAVQDNWRTLLSRGITGIAPESGDVACGENGEGRLASLESIVAAILQAISPKDLAGKKILVSLGPTREFWDPARFWSNPSTGLMGACLAMAAWLRGAEVRVVSGPVSWWFPASVTQVSVTSAAQMRASCLELWPSQDIAVMAAAVSDFAPVPHGGTKFKKSSPDDVPRIEMTACGDILKEMGTKKRQGQLLIGFAAETGDILANARAKLAAKNCDLIAANPIGAPDSGFAASTNKLYLTGKDGLSEEWPVLDKTETAWKLWDIIAAL